MLQSSTRFFNAHRRVFRCVQVLLRNSKTRCHPLPCVQSQGHSHKYCCHSLRDMVTSVHMPEGPSATHGVRWPVGVSAHHVTAARLLPRCPNTDLPALMVGVDAAAGDVGAHAEALALPALRWGALVRPRWQRREGVWVSNWLRIY